MVYASSAANSDMQFDDAVRMLGQDETKKLDELEESEYQIVRVQVGKQEFKGN